MIVFASLLIAQAAAALPPAPEGTILNPVPLTTIEQRLSMITASVAQTDAGGWQCALTGSTGSAYVDQRWCQSTTHCVIEFSDDSLGMDECLADEREEILEEFADYRQGKT